MNNIETKVAIVGAGPAGCAAALQLKRMGIDPVIFEKNRIGGLAINANLIENYLGFPQGITGEEFCKLMEEQLFANVIEIIFEEIEEIKAIGEKFLVKSQKTACTCDYLILATGTIPKEISYKGSKILQEKGLLFYEPIEIPLEKQQNAKVAIIGGGDAAFDYALNLNQKNNDIIIIHKSEEFKCLPLLYYRASNIDSIEIKTSHIVDEFKIAKDKVEISFNDTQKVSVDYVISAIGRKPSNELIDQSLINNKLNKKIFTIGDLVNNNYRQISISSGNGINAAMIIGNQIE